MIQVMKHLLLTAILALVTASYAGSPALTPDGFAIPQPGRTFVFPRDHGSHPELRTEWWYVTGHLDAANGRRFGFQATFFRQSSPDKRQLFLAHTALLDVSSGRFLSEERLNREGWDAGASTNTLDVHNGNWSLRQEDTIKLAATVRAEALITLAMKPRKPLVVFGEDGVSRKGSSPAAASHYLTWPRLDCQGTVRLGDQDVAVTGQAWMDHEFSSSQLDDGQVGWDWASLQLNDGREIMVYRMRRRDGTSDPAGTTLSWVQADGKVQQLDHNQFSWQPTRTWTSPKTKAAYPIGAKIITQGQVFELRPMNNAQELDGAISGLPYWEGACDVLDGQGRVIGRAFLELAGYAGDLARHLGRH